MNIEAFSDNEFNAAEWINSAYKNTDENTEKEIFISSLVSKLQLYVQQVNVALEDTSQQILGGLPKVLKDAQNLQNKVLQLRAKMSEVQAEIAEVQKETGDCMTNLEKLDGLKVKLQIAKEGLQESDGWGKLVSELEDSFEQNDLSKICEKLSLLQKSLAAQEQLPGQSERESQSEGFKNRLEALVSPSVIQCFSTGDIEQSIRYVSIFGDMNRMLQLTQYYRAVQKTTLQQHWTEINELSSDNLCMVLNDFYEFLAESYQKQHKWCIQVFGPNSTNEVLTIISELLPALQPSRSAVILKALNRSTEKLDVLQKFSDSNKHFSNLMKNHFGATTIPSAQYLRSLSNAIFDYFNSFIWQYPVIECSFLENSLSSLNLIQPTAIDTIRALGNANKKLFDWTREACQRCEKITENNAICRLTSSLNTTFTSFVAYYKKAQQQLSASRNIEQNWSLLQSCITLLQNIGDFQNNLNKFEKELDIKILTVYEKSQSSHEEYFCYRIAEKRELNEVKDLAMKIKSNQQKLSESNEINQGIFSSTYEAIKPICSEIHDITLSAGFTPIERQLSNIEPSESFGTSEADLPDYSFAPQECITQIGQYLLTLPQHLEPLLFSPSTALKTALEICDLKYTQNIPSADVLLSLIVEGCCVMYQNQILQIKTLSSTANKQLATDIEYLSSIIEELGLNTTPHLQQISVLLRASPENYLGLSTGCEPRLVTAIRQMRNIISTE